MSLIEYQPGARFPGVIGRTADESSPAWPAPMRATEGTPNVLFIILDDTGYGQFGCYGSPIETPNIDALAKSGVSYNNMHTTALCSPTSFLHPDRAQPSQECNVVHHRSSTGYPGNNGNIPFENGFLSEMLLASMDTIRSRSASGT